MKHTPGPWKHGARRVWAEETEDRLGMELTIHRGNADDSKANARLIASAPDLLLACQTLLDAHTADPMAAGMLLGCAHEMAVAAVTKALGRPYESWEAKNR